MLDCGALRTSTLRDHPFRWGLVTDTLHVEDASVLAASFPEHGFDESSRAQGQAGHDKPYRLLHRTLVPLGAERAVGDDLDPAWRSLAEQVCGPEYRHAVTSLTGVDLGADVPMEAMLWRYDAGCWLAPHPDKPEKLVTHVLYFNEAWDPGWGGTFRVLGSSDVDDVVDEVLPVLGNSVLIVTSSESWHAVTAVDAAAASDVVRKTMTVTFYYPSVLDVR